MEPCDLLSVELRLDRIEAELANELPPHMRSFARCLRPRARRCRPHRTWCSAGHAGDRARRPRASILEPTSGLALLRLVAPDSRSRPSPGVAAARAAAPTWYALAALAQCAQTPPHRAVRASARSTSCIAFTAPPPP